MKPASQRGLGLGLGVGLGIGSSGDGLGDAFGDGLGRGLGLPLGVGDGLGDGLGVGSCARKTHNPLIAKQKLSAIRHNIFLTINSSHARSLN